MSMKKIYTFIVSFAALLTVQSQSITTVEGVYGGRINTITGGKIGTGVLSDSFRVVVATESANSIYYADVKESAFGIISKVNNFTVLPAANASVGYGSGIRKVAYHKVSETIFFIVFGDIYAAKITDVAATKVTTGGGKVDVIIKDDNMYYMTLVGSDNKYYAGTLDGSGNFTASSNATVSGNAYTALVAGKDDKLYSFREGTDPQAIVFDGTFNTAINLSSTTTDAMALSSSYS